jgi:hypothetical protein
MQPSNPTLTEIEETVARMERRYRKHPSFSAYLLLCVRLEADLSDQRDRALAKSAALMQIKYEDEHPSTSA